MSKPKTYPTIAVDEIRPGDVVRLNGRHVPSMPHLYGNFRIIKAKPIGKGLIQVKCRNSFWKDATVRKMDLKIGPLGKLIERDGESMAIEA